MAFYAERGRVDGASLRLHGDFANHHLKRRTKRMFSRISRNRVVGDLFLSRTVGKQNYIDRVSSGMARITGIRHLPSGESVPKTMLTFTYSTTATVLWKRSPTLRASVEV